ncbi:related to AIF1-mitochondrial cell death effector [Sporisorium scitamineum]|uniref:Related to AIF1-mitochondrial cell death effector n=2 Tax=Sporisorium scitamineum TaxID=49012 RepID=A0A127Z6X2_9BASI|nr:related to AIF1-mitochondrial cell death effector [Sporisorium scitamineum]
MSTDELRNVVIVGAASAGMTLVHSLIKLLPATHRIVLIEANPVAFWSIAALRAAVLPGFEQQVIHDLSTATVFGPQPTRHVVLAGTRVIDLQPDHVVVDRDVTSLLSCQREGEGSKIAVDRVVLAVGASSVFPTRTSGCKTKEQVLEQFTQMQSNLAAASSVLVLGGGPTGVEFAGELLDVHPNKKVTLVTRGSGLVTKGNDRLGGMSEKIITQLTAKGVRLILNDSLSQPTEQTGPLPLQTFTTLKGEEITADYIMLASGGKSNTDWIADIDPTLIDSKTKQIKVTPTFSFAGSPRWERYYAYGDAANTPGPKVAYMAGQHAPLLAHNIVNAIRGGGGKLKEAKDAPAEMIMVNVGKRGGAGYVVFVTVGEWITSLFKGRSLHVGMFHGWFKA